MAIWKLTIEDDEGHQTVVPLVRDNYTVGRREGHPIRLTERNVSRDHARLRKDDDGAYLLEDLGSYNGVFVNGHRLVEPKKLQPGDLVILGDYRIEAHSDDAPARLAPSVPPKPSAPPVSVRSDRPAPPTAAPAPTSPDRLVLLGTADAGREYALESKSFTIGRGDEADFRVNHNSVSRQHAMLSPAEGGQWEIKDLSSSNGVRVNGSDTKRGTVKPGDTIELGEVPIKFVGAGQPFLFDAAMAEVAQSTTRKKGGATTWIVVAALVVGAAIGGVVLAGGSNKGPTVASVTASSNTGSGDSAEEGVLNAAKALREQGQIAPAHDKLAEIPASSKLRADKRYVEIENAWADTVARNASAGTDDVRQDAWSRIDKSGADDGHKTAAKALLFPSAANPSTTTTTTAPEPTTTGTTTATTAKPTATATTSAPTATTTSAPTATTTAAPTATVKPTATAPAAGGCASFKGDYMAAFKAREYACVRSILLPLLNAGSISTGQARILKAACNSLGDLSCEKRAAEKTG
jgi:pSer/pThr/pTyr-binding forkhead associated (FHA) protein